MNHSISLNEAAPRSSEAVPPPTFAAFQSRFAHYRSTNSTITSSTQITQSTAPTSNTDLSSDGAEEYLKCNEYVMNKKIISLSKTLTANQALSLAEQDGFFEKLPIHLTFTEISTTLGQNLWSLVESRYPLTQKTFLPAQGVFIVKMPEFGHKAMPNYFFQQFADWILHGVFTRAEVRAVEIYATPTLRFSNGSRKQPDLYLGMSNEPSNLPTVVVETGYSESYPELLRDISTHLIGGAPTISVCFLVKWNLRKPSQRHNNYNASGIIEKYKLDPTTGTRPVS
ncbi:hypothetical protein N7495_008313 [Penicillium taxi]|uniref:uncharacterized protein n=1 Tax=Penicillium taxi TaxID=168475 RepID=UPI00254525E0|nr:uncharacterized protein N7495_008313 [Penicillium taxi]KAJ5888272.1 hypothetical protein N7495_008313 [Penicillium taxi]